MPFLEDDANSDSISDGIPIPSAPLISHLSHSKDEDFSASAPPLSLLDSQLPYNPAASADISSSALSISDSSFPKIEDQPFLQNSEPVIIISKPRKSRTALIAFCCIFCCCCTICCLALTSIGISVATICAGSFHSQYTITPNSDYSAFKKLKFNVDGQVYFYASSVSNIEVKIRKQSKNEAETHASEFLSIETNNSVAVFEASTAPTGVCGFSEYTILLPNNLAWLKQLQLEISTSFGGVQKFGAMNIFPLIIDSLSISSQSGYIAINEVQTVNITKITTVSGSINLNLVSSNVIQLITQSGYVKATRLLISGDTAALQASSASGAIQINQFDVLSKPQSIQIQTNTGYASLEIPVTVTGEYSLQTNTGSLRVLGNVVRQKSVAGTIGAQNITHIVMKSTSGSLQLDQPTKQ